MLLKYLYHNLSQNIENKCTHLLYYSSIFICIITAYTLYSNDLTNIKYNIYLIFAQCIF